MELTDTIPILRIFDEGKAKEFYVEYLGFTLDFEHRFEEGMPLYAQVSRGSVKLHLSEHHGDCTPGAAVRIGVRDLEGLRRELDTKPYRFSNPGIEHKPWGMKELAAIDPFGNRLVFWEDDHKKE